MALPLIPIMLAVTALGSGIAQGISSVKNAKSETNSVRETTEDQISERSRQAKKLMQQQKTSFLKSGVYFDSGTPLAVINETYDTMQDDVNAMADDANSQIKNLTRQGKTAFYNSMLQAVSSAALSYFMAGGMGTGGSTGGQNLTKGGFGQLPTSNGFPSGNPSKIA